MLVTTATGGFLVRCTVEPGQPCGVEQSGKEGRCKISAQFQLISMTFRSS